jgi:zinc and cadmium transporter
MNLHWIILATLIISSIALLGSLLLSLFPRFLKSGTIFLVALAAGTMLSTAFFDLLPEAAHFLGLQNSLWILVGTFATLLAGEKILHWHHCHDEGCENRPLGYMNLLGDSLHNFLDGVLIAASFQVSIPVGIATTVAVALHELPQEIGDFGVLIHSGFSRWQAVLANLGVALVAVIGGLFGFWLTRFSTDFSIYLLPVAAGTFLYLASVDLIPEFRHEESRLKAALLFVCFLVGLVLLPVSTQALGLEHTHGGETHEVQDHEHYEDDHSHDEEDHALEVHDTHTDEHQADEHHEDPAHI